MATTTRTGSLWVPGWARRQLRPWRLGVRRGDVRHRPVITAVGAAFLWSMWAGWATIVGFGLLMWWLFAGTGLVYVALFRAGRDAGYWSAGKVADRV